MLLQLSNQRILRQDCASTFHRDCRIFQFLGLAPEYRGVFQSREMKHRRSVIATSENIFIKHMDYVLKNVHSILYTTLHTFS